MSQNVTSAPEWLYSSVDLTDNSTVVYTGRCMLRSLIVAADISAHDVVVEDTGTTVAGIAASSAAGTVVDCGDLLCLTGITVDPNDAATGTVTVVYKPVYDTAA